MPARVDVSKIVTRHMIYRPRDGKLGYLLYATEKQARDRGLLRESEWTVVAVQTSVTGDVADPSEVTIEPDSLARALLLIAQPRCTIKA